MIHRRMCLVAAFVLLSIAATIQAQTSSTKPKVRAITAFVRLDPATFDRQIADALTVLHAAEREFTQRGYETETIRIVTQPLGELISGQSDAEALRS